MTEKINFKSYFKLFSCCIPVRGSKRSLICDIQREEINFIPNDLFELLNKFEIYTIENILDYYEEGDKETIIEYFEFLLEKEYIFLCDTIKELKCFPNIDMTWQRPSLITNSVIDIKNYDLIFIKDILNELDSFNCKDIQIRLFNFFELQFFDECLKYIFESRIKSIEIVAAYNPENKEYLYVDLCRKHLRINNIKLYSSPFSKIIKCDFHAQTTIEFYENNLIGSLDCGKISPLYFRSNLSLFTEAQLHNTCLNRKIAIDVDGNIKNCPSMPHSYGNIKDTTLQEALEHPDFKKYWNINKDQIEVCKDCEFRYICTDCRAYIEDPHNLYSKPLKCGYNPYTCEWEEWSTNPLKQKAIEYYGMQELVKQETERPSE